MKEWLLQRVDIILGFLLGICGTLLYDLIKNRGKRKDFYRAAYNELILILTELSFYMLHKDANIDEERVKLWWESKKKFNFKGEYNPLKNDPNYKKLNKETFSNADYSEFVKIHNETKDIIASEMVIYPKIKYYYISTNIGTIELLEPSEQSRILGISHRIEVMNERYEALDFYYKRSYDISLTFEHRLTNLQNYFTSVQTLSNYSYVTAKEIIEFLDMIRPKTLSFFQRLKSRSAQK